MIKVSLKLLVGVSFFTIMIFSACGNSDTRNIKDYYFPIESLKEGLVYEYHPVNVDSLPVEYWYYRSIETDSGTYLTANYYDHNFVVRQFFQHQIPAVIESGSVFPFEVSDSSGVFLLKMKWIYQRDPLVSTTLIRNRRFKGSTKYSFKGKEYDCIEFSIKELVDDLNEGHWERQYDGKEIDDNFILEYELANTYSMKILEEKFKQTIGMIE